MKLPKQLGEYIRAQNARDSKAIFDCFSPNAFVHDEGRDYRGAAAVKGWIKDTLAKYEFQIEPLRLSKSATDQVLTARLSGSFPGSPVTVGFRFSIKESLIASLIVEPAAEA